MRRMQQPMNIKACVVIEFNDKASENVIKWFSDKVTSENRGCRLSVTRLDKDGAGSVNLLISASKLQMKIGAELHGIRKKYKDGSMVEFNFTDEQNFLNYKDDDFLTDGECLYVIKSELDGIRASEEDSHVPGQEKLRLYPGKSILRKLKSAKIITNIFCLHNEEKLKKLVGPWYKNKNTILEQPIDEIHEYFGDTISMYFAFLGYYTKSLVPLILASIPFHLISSSSNEIQSYSGFAAVNLIWAAIFLEMWKRKSAELAYKFGNFQKREWEEPRGEFRGILGENAITKQMEPQYPEWKRTLRVFLISAPIIFLCILSAVGLMFYYFSWDFYCAKKYDGMDTILSKIARNAPSVLYSLLVLIANSAYRKLAELLTDQENHRLESSYQNHLITKIVLFDFVNNFLCLFYIAFIYNNVDMLRKTLRNLFIVQIVISQLLESVIPYWSFKRRARQKKESLEKESTSAENDDLSKQIKLEMKRDIYVGTFDDYLELWLQFGYVVMFSCAFPFASLLAFINNVVEIRSDAFKICNVFRRPFSIPTRNIGAWQTAFTIISYMGVVSNCALIFLSPGFQNWFFRQSPTATTITILLYFVAVEHILVIVRYLLTALIPGVPHYIQVAVAKMQYRSLLALKKERNASLQGST